LICTALVAALFSTLALISDKAGIEARQLGRLDMVGHAIQDYYEVHGRFPPAYVLDDSGKPMHSWRVLLLPHLGYHSLFERYDMQKPWDSAENLELAEEMPDEYRCPRLDRLGTTTTNCVGVVGAATAWSGPLGRKRADFVDGLSTTIMVLLAPDTGINWLEPRDLAFDQLFGDQSADATEHLEMLQSSCIYCCTADGPSARLVNATPDVLYALLTVAGSEAIRVEDIGANFTVTLIPKE